MRKSSTGLLDTLRAIPRCPRDVLKAYTLWVSDSYTLITYTHPRHPSSTCSHDILPRHPPSNAPHDIPPRHAPHDILPRHAPHDTIPRHVTHDMLSTTAFHDTFPRWHPTISFHDTLSQWHPTTCTHSTYVLPRHPNLGPSDIVSYANVQRDPDRDGAFLQSVMWY